MYVTPTMAKLHQCPRCGGMLYKGFDDDYCCVMCGEYVYVTARPIDQSPPKRRGRRPGSRIMPMPLSA